MFFFFKQKTAYEMRISDWSSDVCSSDLEAEAEQPGDREPALRRGLPPPRHRQYREAVGDRREQQHRGVERDQRQLEQLARAGAAGIAGAAHRIGREQDREEEAVAPQVQPEAEPRAAAVGVMLLLAAVEVRDRGAGRRPD